MATPPEIAGTIGEYRRFIIERRNLYSPIYRHVGAVFNSAFQLGNALELAIVTSIQTSIAKKYSDPEDYAPTAAGFWFLVALIAVMGISVAIFMKPIKKNDMSTDAESGDSSTTTSTGTTDDEGKRNTSQTGVYEGAPSLPLVPVVSEKRSS